MLNLILGAALVGAAAVALWAALPVDGKMRSWNTPQIAPLVAVIFTGAVAIGFGLMLASAVSFFRG